jgi:formylglycine-generating enzyme required for sulfatase activity
MCEYCADRYVTKNFPKGPAVDPYYPYDPSHPALVIRGGEYLVGLWESARRYGVSYGGNAHGFRVVVGEMPGASPKPAAQAQPEPAPKKETPAAAAKPAKPAPAEPGLAAAPAVAAPTGDLPRQLTLDLGKGVKLALTLIPAGTFTMGSTDTRPKLPETPPHKVTISKPFYMGVTEVTQKQFQTVMGTNPTPEAFRDPTHPVEYMNWARVTGFCAKASAITGRKVRLPTEAEWEYACRAGTKTKYFWGDSTKEMNEYAWTPANSKVDGKVTTHPVGKLKPNPWGLYDICGNVFEFTSDNYRDDWRYPDKPVTDPTGAPEATKRKRKVLRGGAFDMGWCRSARRCWGPLGSSGRDHGMRVVVEVPATAPATRPSGGVK